MKKPKNTALTTVSWLFLYLAVTWLAVLLSMNYESGMSVLELFPKMTQALADPFAISLNEHGVLFIRGAKPVWDRKFKLESHMKNGLTANGQGDPYVHTKAKLMTMGNQMDEKYRRVVYVRYADDFLIGVIGSKQDAENIKTDIGTFLKKELQLEMSEKKTLVTNARDKARFLSYDIYSNRSQNTKKDKNGVTRRVHSERISLYVPKEKWVNRLISYGALKIEYDSKQWKQGNLGTGTQKTPSAFG